MVHCFVDPGDTIKIKLVNDLPEADAEYQFFDDTSLHTHGLHVSAQGDSDNGLLLLNVEILGRQKSRSLMITLSDLTGIIPTYMEPPTFRSPRDLPVHC